MLRINMDTRLDLERVEWVCQMKNIGYLSNIYYVAILCVLDILIHTNLDSSPEVYGALLSFFKKTTTTTTK